MNTITQAFNPFLPLTEYIPDGEPHVFGDRIYLFGSHDKFDGDHFCMNDYVCYSAALNNVKEWRYEGVVFRKEQDPRNTDGSHYLWAPDVTQGPDGRYYLFYCFDTLPELGVAVCDTPAGEYQYLDVVRYKDGTPLGTREGDYIQFDPAAFVDDDGEVYLYSGNGPKGIQDFVRRKHSQVMTLEPDMVTLKSEPKLFFPTILEGVGTDFEGHEFFEASSIRKINGTYYFVYSDIVTHSLCYATSRYPDRDYQYRGAIIALGDIGLEGINKAKARNYLGNIHGGIECANGKWYVFYHRQTNQTQFSRQACAEEITILPDGSIPQVEMTSCGLNGGALIAEGTYPATIACNLTSRHGCCFSDWIVMALQHPYFTQEGEDGAEDAYPYIRNIKSGATAGYKYFALNGKSKLTLTVRGRGNGVFVIRCAEEGAVLGTIPVEMDCAVWKEASAQVCFPIGTYPLYITYEGSGVMDLLQFQFDRG